MRVLRLAQRPQVDLAVREGVDAPAALMQTLVPVGPEQQGALPERGVCGQSEGTVQLVRLGGDIGGDITSERSGYDGSEADPIGSCGVQSPRELGDRLVELPLRDRQLPSS